MSEKIAVYAGSFNPFHIGHLDIVTQAGKIFDEVIIARGINPEKDNELYDMPSSVTNRVDNYDGLLTDYLENKINLGYKDITLVRGLRNAADLEYEMNQHRYLEDLMPNIKIVYILGDRKYSHISSSAIRMMKEKFGKGDIFIPDNI